jgi:hypothetical protein
MATETLAPTPDLAKLETQANELRGAMVTALGLDPANPQTPDDDKARKLGNDLTAVKKQILDVEITAQGSSRDLFRDAMHDALNAFELPGLTLTVKYDVNDVAIIVYTPTPSTIDGIKAAVADIERPSSATKWTYGRDEEGFQSFEFANAGPKRSANSTNGSTTSKPGWIAPNGTPITLSDAFKACATAEQLAEYATRTTSNSQYAFKNKVAREAGYKKS